MLSGWEVLTGLHTQEQEAVLHMDATALIMDDGGGKKKNQNTGAKPLKVTRKAQVIYQSEPDE